MPPPAILEALERPKITGEIDAPAVFTVGQAEIRPSPGTRFFVMSADDRVCGVLIEGGASLTYRVRDTLSQALTRRNAGRADGVVVREANGEMTLSATLRSSAIWGWDLEIGSQAIRPATGARMPDWLSELLARKLDNNPGRDMLLSAWNGERGYRWAALRTTGDDLMLDVDPRHSVLLESLHRVERLPRSAVAYSGWASFEQLTAQPIGKPWLQPPATDLVSEDVEIDVRNPAGNQVVVRSRSRVKSLRTGYGPFHSP